MNEVKYLEFDGLDNVNRPEEQGKTMLSRAKNVNISAAKKISLRAGQERLLTGSFHSLWANADICLAVKSGDLVSVSRGVAATTLLRQAVGDNRMSYVDINGVTYFSNEVTIGYVQNLQAYEIAQPTIDYRRAPLPGQLLEHYNGSLLIARDNVLWFTDAYVYNRVDLRKNFKQLASRILMLSASDDGVYLSDQESVYFAQGPRPNKWALRKVCDSPAVFGSATKLDGKRISPEVQGAVCFWLTKEGVHMGGPGGQVTNITLKRFRPPACVEGAALYREEENLKQIIISIQN